jgi:iron(III) transport system ATP-binding protein
MTTVDIVQISKSYEPGKPVLDRMNLSVRKGEIFFLLGPSGCGKSTLLRLIAGFLQPDAGAIRIGERDVTNIPSEHRETAMVFQNYALWPHLTVAENVSFGLEVRRISPPERKRRVSEVLEQVGLSELAGRRPAALSGGQQQRVALARAVVVRPKVLLLDEPLSNLDAKLRVEMRSEIRRICRESGLTTIYVTHDQKEALSIGDRIAVLDCGRIRQIGHPYEIYRRPADRMVADFIGETLFLPAEVSRVDGASCQVRGDFGEWCSTNHPASLTVGDRVEIALRPESLRFVAENSDSPPGTNRISGVLREGRFLGDVSHWSILCGRVELYVAEMNPPPRNSGDACILQIDSDQVVVVTTSQ